MDNEIPKTMNPLKLFPLNLLNEFFRDFMIIKVCHSRSRTEQESNNSLLKPFLHTTNETAQMRPNMEQFLLEDSTTSTFYTMYLIGKHTKIVA